MKKNNIMKKYRLKEGALGYIGIPTGVAFDEDYKAEDGILTVAEMVDLYPEDWEEVPIELTPKQKEAIELMNGVIDNAVRSFNVGASDYSKHKIQPWDIWLEYGLNPWDADIIKRVLRNKEGENRITEYEKIIHICQERIRQLKTSNK